jgi:hypothetical protein
MFVYVLAVKRRVFVDDVGQLVLLLGLALYLTG